MEEFLDYYMLPQIICVGEKPQQKENQREVYVQFSDSYGSNGFNWIRRIQVHNGVFTQKKKKVHNGVQRCSTESWMAGTPPTHLVHGRGFFGST